MYKDRVVPIAASNLCDVYRPCYVCGKNIYNTSIVTTFYLTVWIIEDSKGTTNWMCSKKCADIYEATGGCINHE